MTAASLVFQSTPPCGGRRGRPPVPHRFWPVSIHAPLRGATIKSPLWSAAWMFQSTPPCGGRPASTAGSSIAKEVSIHAPLRGATQANEQKLGKLKVSIHAPLRGATHFPAAWSMYSKDFNPRPPAGGDPQIGGLQNGFAHFNPRPPAGGDLFTPTPCAGLRDFNPRPPAGGDPPSSGCYEP